MKNFWKKAGTPPLPQSAWLSAPLNTRPILASQSRRGLAVSSPCCPRGSSSDGAMGASAPSDDRLGGPAGASSDDVDSIRDFFDTAKADVAKTSFTLADAEGLVAAVEAATMAASASAHDWGFGFSASRVQQSYEQGLLERSSCEQSYHWHRNSSEAKQYYSELITLRLMKAKAKVKFRVTYVCKH